MKLFLLDDSAPLFAPTTHLEGCACGDCAVYDKPAPDGDATPTLPLTPYETPSDGRAGERPVGTGPATSVDLATDVGALAPDGPVFVDTVPGDATTTVTLTLGTAVDGTLDTVGDRDWYRITLTAGQTYTFTTSGTGSGDIEDSYLRLHNAAGTQIAFNDDIGAGNYFSRIVYTATATGTYFVNVGAYNDAEAGNFRLRATVDVADAIPGNSTTTASVTVGGPAVAGVLDVVGDHDWYAVTLTAGQSYLLRTNPTGGANDPDTYLRLYAGNGSTLLAQNDDGGGGTYSAIRFTPTTSGTYYLDVGAFDDGGAGAYNISVGVAPPLPIYTNDQIADQLLNGYWGGPQAARHFNVAPGGTITVNMTGLAAAGQALAREAFNLWSDAMGITFQEITGTAQITLDDNESGAYASSTRSGNIILSSVVNVGTAWLTSYGTGLNSYSFQTYLHEIGHALGLGHAGPYNGSASYGQDNSYQNDAWATTVMSYFDQTENSYFAGQGYTRQFVVSPIVADVLAMSIAYGTATTTRTGDTVYGFNNSSGRVIYDAAQFPSVSYTVVDHGGTDTLDYSGFGQNQRIDLNAEAFSNVGARVGNVTIARGSLIENAFGGSGNDTLIGNAAANILRGGAGADVLRGFDGNDTLQADAADTVIDGGAGFDTAVFSASGTVAAQFTAIEGLSVTGGANIGLTSSQIAGQLPRTLQLGGNGTITVTLEGTASDRVVVNTSSASIVAGSSLQFVVNGSAGNNIIKMADVAATVNGGSGVDQIRGGALADTIYGGNGNDKLIGLGGADIIYGGGGADQFRYYFRNDSGLGTAADRIMDFVPGTDRLDFRVLDTDLTTPGYQHLTLIGTAAFAANGTAQIRYQTQGTDILVEADINGDSVADMQIVLVGLGGQTLNAADFWLTL